MAVAGALRAAVTVAIAALVGCLSSEGADPECVATRHSSCEEGQAGDDGASGDVTPLLQVRAVQAHLQALPPAPGDGEPPAVQGDARGAQRPAQDTMPQRPAQASAPQRPVRVEAVEPRVEGLATVAEPQSSLDRCGCQGNPHVGGRVPGAGLQCLRWSGDGQCGDVVLSKWADGTRCTWVGDAGCHQSPCSLEPTGFNWIFGTDRTSQCTLQYAGAYQFDGSSFHRVDSSSFNCDHAYAAQDLNPDSLASQLAEGRLWLPPYPGGSAEWVAGFTPYDTMARYGDGARVLSVGGPAFMMVAKFVGPLSHMTWYVLNQRTLLNGAMCGNSHCGARGNCWGCGYGEVDILEGNYCEPNLCMTLTNGQVGGAGACLYGDTSRENVYSPSSDGESPLIAAVFDKQGVTVYVNPTWEGLTDTTAAPELGPRPTAAEKVVKAPASVRGMWKDLQDTQQLPASGSHAPPTGPRRKASCAQPGMDVWDQGLYSVPVPAACCDGSRPIQKTNSSGPDVLVCRPWGGASLSVSQ